MKVMYATSILLLAGHSALAEFEVTNLEKNPGKEILVQQELFRKEVEKAVLRVRPKDVVI